MSNEIKDGINAGLPPGAVPVSLDVDAVVSSGHRAHRRRTLFAGGGAFMSVLAVGGLTVALVGPGVAATEGDDPDTSHPGFAAGGTDEPVLDPDKDYFWSIHGDPNADDPNGSSPYDEQVTATSAALTEAFWAHLQETYPGVALWENRGYSGNEEPVNQGWVEQPGDPVESGYLQQHTSALFEGTGDFDNAPPIEDLVLERTSFGMYHFGENMESTGGVDLRFSERADTVAEDRVVLDLVSFNVYPAGSHTRRTGDAMDLIPECVDALECEVEDIEGPNGEDIRTLTTYGQWSEEGPTDSIVSRLVVLYGEDGSAVVISNTLSLDTAEYEEDPVPPALSFEQLSDFAIAMSEVELETD